VWWKSCTTLKNCMSRAAIVGRNCVRSPTMRSETSYWNYSKSLEILSTTFDVADDEGDVDWTPPYYEYGVAEVEQELVS
jgi:hypothetical protein